MNNYAFAVLFLRQKTNNDIGEENSQQATHTSAHFMSRRACIDRNACYFCATTVCADSVCAVEVNWSFVGWPLRWDDQDIANAKLFKMLGLNVALRWTNWNVLRKKRRVFFIVIYLKWPAFVSAMVCVPHAQYKKVKMFPKQTEPNSTMIAIRDLLELKLTDDVSLI